MQMLDPVSLAILFLTLSIVPFVAIALTSYAKIVIVLGLLRNAMGVQQVPPNTVLNGIALIVSVYIMAPVGFEALDAFKTHPQSGNTVSAAPQIFSYVDAAKDPFRRFLAKHAHEREKAFFPGPGPLLMSALTIDDIVILLGSDCKASQVST